MEGEKGKNGLQGVLPSEQQNPGTSASAPDGQMVYMLPRQYNPAGVQPM